MLTKLQYIVLLSEIFQDNQCISIVEVILNPLNGENYNHHTILSKYYVKSLFTYRYLQLIMRIVVCSSIRG